MKKNRPYQANPSERGLAISKHRQREIRDLFSKLRARYQEPLVYLFFEQNYFIQTSTIYQIIKRADNEPVDLAQASIQYKTAMQDNFHL